MRLLLIRHGQTIDNVNGELGTLIPGPGLTDLGRRQAAAVPDALSSERIDAVYASSMQRTVETAGPLARALGLEIQVLDGLREVTAGDLEARSDTEAIRTYMRTVFSWWTDLDARIPGGESGTEFYGRFTGAIDQIVAEHHARSDGSEGTVAVFSHGAAIRAWASYASANVDPEFSKAHNLENTAIVVVEGSAAEGWLTTYWAGEPIGGERLEDASAPDPTGTARG